MINLVTTVIGFTVSTMFIVYVCISFICARILLNASRRSFPVAPTPRILKRGLHVLEPAVAADFPTKKYCNDLFLTLEDSQCTVCLSEYVREDILRILPYCGHAFHVTCIDIWLQEHSTCPVCRISVRECPGRNRMMQPLFSSALRTQHGMETLEDGLSSRALGILPIQENRSATQVNENLSSLTEDDQIVKDSGNKRVESSSSP